MVEGKEVRLPWWRYFGRDWWGGSLLKGKAMSRTETITSSMWVTQGDHRLNGETGRPTIKELPSSALNSKVEKLGTPRYNMCVTRGVFIDT